MQHEVLGISTDNPVEILCMIFDGSVMSGRCELSTCGTRYIFLVEQGFGVPFNTTRYSWPPFTTPLFDVHAILSLGTTAEWLAGIRIGNWFLDSLSISHINTSASITEY